MSIELPEDVWGLIKEYAIPRCPACKGYCAYEDMPCWLDDLSQRMYPNVPSISPRYFRKMWYKAEHARACNSPELEELKKFWLDMNEYPDPGEYGDDDTFF